MKTERKKVIQFSFLHVQTGLLENITEESVRNYISTNYGYDVCYTEGRPHSEKTVSHAIFQYSQWLQRSVSAR